MLKPKEVESYTGTLNEVVSDLIGRLHHQRNRHERHVVKNVANEFYKFGLEGILLLYPFYKIAPQHFICIQVHSQVGKSRIMVKCSVMGIMEPG